MAGFNSSNYTLLILASLSDDVTCFLHSDCSIQPEETSPGWFLSPSS